MSGNTHAATGARAVLSTPVGVSPSPPRVET
jgi:hypothetical protein